MARIGDALYLPRLVELLQTRDPIDLPELIDPTKVGLVISIDAADVLQLAGRRNQAHVLTLRTIANPAAGAHWSVTVPAGEIWQLWAITYRLVTSAVAGVRSVGHVIDEGALGGLLIPFISEQARVTGQAASITADYAYYGANRTAFSNAAENLGPTDSGAGSTMIGPVPDLLVPAGQRLRSVMFGGTAFGVADQFSRVRVLHEVWRAGT